MFKIKICGITSVEDALLAAEAGADAIGLNFYEKSPRYVTPELARQIVEATLDGPEKVGVFVNAPVSQVENAVRETPLDAVQIHGDESPSFLRDLRRVLPTVQRPSPDDPQKINVYSSSIIRAFRWPGGDLSEIAAYLKQCQQLDAMPNAVLIDSHVKGEYGGTGRTADWKALADQRSLLGELPLFLAGGLSSSNVVDAIKACRPDWVDVASGVESSAGKKDPEKLESFVMMAKVGWASDALGHLFDRPPK